MSQSTRKTGAGSELAVVNYLIAKGYLIIQTNFYCRYGELDIIASEGDELVFVEVKSIVANAEISPLQMLQPHKLQRIQRSIDFWLIKHRRLSAPWRFEFIGVTLDERYTVKDISHIINPEL